MIADKLKGMLWGSMVGCAIGIAYKYRYGSLPYTDQIQQHSSMELGQISADGENLLATLISLLDSSGVFDKDTMIKGYCDWATSDGGNIPDISNHIKLFFGSASFSHYNHAADFSAQNTSVKGGGSVKPDQRLQTYDRVYTTYITNAPQYKWSMNNESLVRCIPYACSKKCQGWLPDCMLTHPHILCQEATDMLVILLRSCIDSTYQFHYEPTQPDISAALKDAQIRSHRDIHTNRSYICHTLYVAFRCYLTGFTFTEGMKWIISQHPNSDTCSNAIIGGAVLGAKIGYERMITEDTDFRKNLDIVRDCRSERPRKYHPSIIDDEMIQKLAQLYV